MVGVQAQFTCAARIALQAFDQLAVGDVGAMHAQEIGGQFVLEVVQRCAMQMRFTTGQDQLDEVSRTLDIGNVLTGDAARLCSCWRKDSSLAKPSAC